MLEIACLSFWLLLLPFPAVTAIKTELESRGEAKPSPISIPPTEAWDGNDGPWSSFGMQIGSPPQDLRLLPSTAGNVLSPVLSGGCPSNSSPANCPDLRATFFSANSSSTWSDLGLYELDTAAESPLGYQVNASYGLDEIIVSRPGDSGMPHLQDQIIAGFIDDSVYMGLLGLYPYSVNITNFTSPRLSFLGSLRNESKVPSTSWAYTAGAFYRQPSAFGSLTLGGYDAERFIPNSLSIPFGADMTRDLLAGLQKISTSTADSGSPSKSLLTSGIYVFLNSMVPDIWLPTDVCQAFEETFGLTYNETANKYFVNDTLHNRLLSTKPNVTFTIGTEATGGQTVDIVMQYGSFDLQYEDPRTGQQARYFPLKRAQNYTMYTLGRAFFQDAYIIANYEYFNFSISQAIFPDRTYAQRLVPIEPFQSFNSTKPTGKPDASTRKSLGAGTIIGIVLGILILLGIACGSPSLWRRLRRKRIDSRKEKQPSEYHKPELCATGTSKYEMAGDDKLQLTHAELNDSRKPPAELWSAEPVGSELATPGTVSSRDSTEPSNERVQHVPSLIVAELEDTRVYKLRPLKGSIGRTRPTRTINLQ